MEKNLNEFYIVGVGASAGGLEALQEFISHLPKELPNAAIIVAQHLSPTYKSMLVQLLGRQTSLEVIEARNGLNIVPGKIYITPPDSEIAVKQNFIQLKKAASGVQPKPSVDAFFQSLAEEKQEKSIGIILSGTGTDGANGIRAIKNAGGITIAQEPQTAKYDGMPISAIETGQVDLVLSPDKIGEELQEILNTPPTLLHIKEKQQPNNALDKILHLLSKRSGTDFSNYKPSTICRRLEKRMATLKIEKGLEQYVEYVENHPEELDILFDNVLIGVTSFFRDTEAFKVLEKYLAKIVINNSATKQIRIWTPGCATGEETYSIAILLAKILGNKLSDYNIQIFGTDIDEKAITHARKALYDKSVVANIPDYILDSYFLKKGNQYEVIKPIRQLVLFSKHDVANNPPFLKLDLISCRNLLIYFGQNLQKHIIPIFHYALNPDGYLFLGKSETVGQFTDLFQTIDGKYKIFQRKRGSHLHTIRFSGFKPNLQQTRLRTIEPRTSSQQKTIPEMVRETLYNTFEHPYVIINDTMDILEINGDVRMFLGFTSGEMNSNIIKLAHKDLQIELRSVINKAIKENQSVKSEKRKIDFFDKKFAVQICVKPLLYAPIESPMLMVIFESQELKEEDITQVEKNDKNIARILELEHELAATKENLQTFIEELETANEELQSLNEELQSSNEELETSNEELQSTNEELQIAYTELKAANEEIERQAALLQISEQNAKALLNNTLQSFILINSDYKVSAYNELAEKLFVELFDKHLKPNQNIIDIIPENDFDFFHKELKKSLTPKIVVGEHSFKDKKQQERWFKYNFTPVINKSGQAEGVSLALLEITEQKKTEKELLDNEKLINSIFNCADIGICVTNKEAKFVKANQAYCDLYGYTMDEIIGKPFTIVVPPEHREFALKMHRNYLEGSPETPGKWRVQRKNGENMWVWVTASRLIDENGNAFKVTTVRRLGEHEAQDVKPINE
ncbi:MAG: PAS domain S-box protein [Cytophagales bacterium]|nr:PAS domain S-box protein [Cytophagales bacterium]MDW8383759.1 chemotaxis protein CheB [Flammeovirgaceae bacterium]